jgi:cysteine desulfurase family protein (TIGR01976 family)
MAVAADVGAAIREIEVDLATCTLDLATLEDAISERTRLVAVGYASNATGTVNPVAEIVRRARAVGALTFVDAVHFAPHGPLYVAALGADFVACSAYKFFGPHLGILWGRSELLAALPAYKVRPAEDRWETGTQNHEGIAGTLAAVEYLASVGERFGGVTPGASRRKRLLAGMAAIEAYERELSLLLLDGLATVPGLTLHGLADPARIAERTPTFALTLDGWSPRAVTEALAARGIYAWNGDFYATTLIEDLGLADAGGVVRVGLVHYNTAAEVERLLAALREIATQRPGS